MTRKATDFDLAHLDDTWALGSDLAAMPAVASAALIVDDRLLLVREGEGADRRRWNLPGGKVRAGEPLAAAAVRETREETGYRIALDGLAGVYPYRKPAGAPRLRCVFTARILGGRPRGDGREKLARRWLSLAELAVLPHDELAKPALLRRILADLCAPQRDLTHVLREWDRAQIVT
jgi:8-oxo-dGTP diphosphatase